MYLYIEKLVEIVAVVGVLVLLIHNWHLKKENKELLKEKQKILTEIADLRIEGGIQSVKRAERSLRQLSPSVCPVCEQILFLALSTTYVQAMERLDALKNAVPHWGDVLTSRHTELMLQVLDRASSFTLWQWPLEKSDERPNPERMLVSLAMQVYNALVPHLSKANMERAIHFCVQSCANENERASDLRREAAVMLLPTLLRCSQGDEGLVST